MKRLTQGRHGQSTRLTLESGGYCFHYMIEGGVVFLTMADRGYPKKLAYQYLDELQKEFTSLYASEVRLRPPDAPPPPTRTTACHAQRSFPRGFPRA